MLIGQILSEIFVKSRQHNIFDSVDSNHTGVAVMEGRCGHEVADNFIPLGALKVNSLQSIAGRVRLLRKMPAPTWMSEAKVLATAITSNPLRAFLFWRTVSILHTNGPLNATFDEGQPVESVNKLAGHGDLKNCVRLLEIALDDLHLQALHMLGSMAL